MSDSTGRILDGAVVARSTEARPGDVVMVGNEPDPNAPGFLAADPDRLARHEEETANFNPEPAPPGQVYGPDPAVYEQTTEVVVDAAGNEQTRFVSVAIEQTDSPAPPGS
jgi:hypothetical protein